MVYGSAYVNRPERNPAQQPLAGFLMESGLWNNAVF